MKDKITLIIIKIQNTTGLVCLFYNTQNANTLIIRFHYVLMKHSYISPKENKCAFITKITSFKLTAAQWSGFPLILTVQITATDLYGHQPLYY